MKTSFACALFFAGGILLAASDAHAQSAWTPKPNYPFAARKQGMQGRGVVRATFTNIFTLPASVDMVKSTGSALLDATVVDYVRRNWILIYFTPAERKDPGLMDRRLKPFIPGDSRRSIVDDWSKVKNSTMKPFPQSRTVPIAFLLAR